MFFFIWDGEVFKIMKKLFKKFKYAQQDYLIPHHF